ncbi:TRAP transporter small permease [Mesorhizobium sp. CGMCC 1.15528]|uniref:TRAP transporter small permease protein n=1 Tax=Mesorhizobium zhangyense TaxID=1776730 RepID=A0A7C9R721_9HYPH|nr:TRAP transporter small permease [Mesorhizobium zhangyense]NGN41734.1 TRAP transporter small permease [Mesorhizobium zhangyense]
MTSRYVGAALLRAADLGFRALEAALVLVLAAMVTLVFANVVMRYVFDSGITVTDELSRMMFVWISFLGAILVARRSEHLGVDLLTATLSPASKRICRILADIGIVICSAILASGAFSQTVANMSNIAPVSGLPTGLTYAAPFLAGLAIGVIAFADLLGAVLSPGTAETDDLS